jgi:hypothetical protein
VTVRAEWVDEAEPAYAGAAGKVWRFSTEGQPDDPRQLSSVGASWLIFAPGAHLFWSWHVLMAVALRDVPGLPPAKKRYPAAEYELLVMALNPEAPPPDPRRWPRPGELSILDPPDVVVQFDEVPGGDEGVAQLLELVAQSCTDGRLIPDSDWRSAWERAIPATLQHVREGRHSFGERGEAT